MLHVHVNAAFRVNASCPMFMYIYREMPDCKASDQSGTGLKKIYNDGTDRYRTKLTQSCIFLVRYRAKIRDAGMPMIALVFSMPMPSYGIHILEDQLRCRSAFHGCPIFLWFTSLVFFLLSLGIVGIPPIVIYFIFNLASLIYCNCLFSLSRSFFCILPT